MTPASTQSERTAVAHEAVRALVGVAQTLRRLSKIHNSALLLEALDHALQTTHLLRDWTKDGDT